MADATPATVAASQSSFHTMLETIEHGTEILQQEMPVIAEIGGFVPGATPFIQIVGLCLGPVQNAIKFIMEEEGKSPMEAFRDFLNHIAPKNGYVSPALSKPAPST